MVDGRTRLAVVGAGLIGKRHVQAIRASSSATLAAIVDPLDAARGLAEALAVPWCASLRDLIAQDRPDGVVLATPNQAHVDGALACVAAGLPVLVEKPLATDPREARHLVDAAEAASVPLLTGHHRRHNPLVAAAKAAIEAGELGTVVAAHAMVWLMKPDDYFDVAWRREPGGGPIYLNLIHDVDLLRHLVGEIVSVTALESRAVRGHDVEDTAVILLAFASGALGTVNLSDTIAAPWSWELTAGENPAYPRTDEACYLIGGTHGALELPNNRLWHHPGGRSWWAPISARSAPMAAGDPLVRQIEQFVAVIRGAEPPLVSGREGLRALEVVEAIKASAVGGGSVVLPAPA